VRMETNATPNTRNQTPGACKKRDEETGNEEAEWGVPAVYGWWREYLNVVVVIGLHCTHTLTCRAVRTHTHTIIQFDD
jgi:hypothetical protein